MRGFEALLNSVIWSLLPVLCVAICPLIKEDEYEENYSFIFSFIFSSRAVHCLLAEIMTAGMKISNQLKASQLFPFRAELIPMTAL